MMDLEEGIAGGMLLQAPPVSMAELSSCGAHELPGLAL